MKAIIYGTDKCTWCYKVAKRLQDAGIDITKVDVTDADNLEEMKKFSGKDAITVPQVVIDEKYIGGYTETERFLNIVSLKSITKS